MSTVTDLMAVKVVNEKRAGRPRKITGEIMEELSASVMQHPEATTDELIDILYQTFVQLQRTRKTRKVHKTTNA